MDNFYCDKLEAYRSAYRNAQSWENYSQKEKSSNPASIFFVKTDSIFYRLFQEFPSIFFELIGDSPEIAANYQFSSVEVKQTAFRIDGVFLPQTPQQPIYFVEVQFQEECGSFLAGTPRN